MASSFTEATYSLVNSCTEDDIVTFEGCSESISLPLLNSHRYLLRKEMTEILAVHKEVEKTLDQCNTKPESHPLMKQIDKWEHESIEKIQQRSKELRQQLLQVTGDQTNRIDQRFQTLSRQVMYYQNGEAFIEEDLRRWKKTLNDLKTNLVSPSTIAINQYVSAPLVENIYVILTTINELFLQTYDNKVQIEENGQLAVHDLSFHPTEIRGRNTYTSGCHKIRLYIEQSTNEWTFLGINSKLTPLQNQSFSCSSSYGWSSNNYIWLNGERKASIPDKCMDMKNSDIISLIIDCEKCSIMIINERSQVKHELIVDANKCPLPWQLHVVLHEPNSHLRILQD